MKSDLTNLDHLRQTALEAVGLIGSFASAAAEDIQEVAAGLPVSRRIELTAALWQGSGPYSQSAAVEGVRADEAGQLVQVVPAEGSRAAWEAAGVKCSAQGAETLTFTAKEKPGASLVVFAILQEV